MEASAALTAMPTSGTDASDGGREGSVMIDQYARGGRGGPPGIAGVMLAEGPSSGLP